MNELRQGNTTLDEEIELLKMQVKELTIINNLASKLGQTLEFDVFLEELVSATIDTVKCERALVLVSNEQDTVLEFGACNFRSQNTESQNSLENFRLNTFHPEVNSIAELWLAGSPAQFNTASDIPHPSFGWITEVMEITSYISSPMMLYGQLTGVVIVGNSTDQNAFSESQQKWLDLVANSAATPLQNARLHHKTVEELADSMREMYILRQIDRELNDTIDLNHVFEITLDWALRFTNAHSTSLALYDQDTNNLHFLMEYGYDLPQEQIQMLRQEYGNGLTARVANSGYAEVVPDISTDADYVRLANNTRSQMAVPVMREDRVVAVITLESKKLNGFTDTHLDFVQKLATRAGVAIDNARLYEESIRERGKLSHILNNTADVVMVIGHDDRIILINQSALSALRLYANQDYSKQHVAEVLERTSLLKTYQRAKAAGENITEEVVMPNERIFHANFRRFETIGWIVVMHDITPFKEMDRLKGELIATVSHDLKQPLSVMNGYIELMIMQQSDTSQGLNSVQMIRRAMQNMRQLIDDLLDLAKIESGIKLDLQAVAVQAIIQECVDQVRPAAQNKSMTIINNVADDLAKVSGDRSRLRQILINLISNAVKYTAPEGWVKIDSEVRGNTVRITVQDNGMGISPEDQIHVFERFYRVRRPETDSIEGTGLGLAIVKSLVEAHGGQIGLESKMGEGTTFFLVLPTNEEVE
ncbi:MAG: ATP-binding protein [Anaerolineae bacterium]